jgi:Mn2+/Fe2+ NRAMP family transporter
MKCIIIVLTLSTVSAVILSAISPHSSLSLKPVIPNNTIGIAFLIAFFGWMPAPLDISVWQSIWTNEKRKSLQSFDTKSSIIDFKIGYFFTVILGLCFMGLGAFVAFDSSNNLNGSALEFSNKLINLYAQSLGDWSYYLIAIAAFTTMFSTTLTTLDASPRVMSHCLNLFGKKNFLSKYKTWLIFLIVGTLIIFYGFLSEMGTLIKIATIFSFLTAPLYAILNYLLISSRHTPKNFHPKKRDHILSISGIIFLIGFSIWYILSL